MGKQSMQGVQWLAAALAGAVTFFLRKQVQLLLDGALYQVWAPPLPPGVKIAMPTTTQEMWNALARWWQQVTLGGWLLFIGGGVAAGLLLYARCRADEGNILQNIWLVPALALAALVVVDYPPAVLWTWMHVQGARLWALFLLLALVLVVNLLWAALLEKTVLILEERIPEWLA